jgi:hypothetical protein
MTGKQHLPLNRRTTDIVSGPQNPIVARQRRRGTGLGKAGKIMTPGRFEDCIAIGARRRLASLC